MGQGQSQTESLEQAQQAHATKLEDLEAKVSKSKEADHQNFFSKRQSNAPSEHIPYKPTCFHFPDIFFAFLFACAAGVMFYLAYEWGFEKVFNATLNCETAADLMDDFQLRLCDHHTSNEDFSGYLKMFNIFGYVAMGCLIASFIWIRVILCCGSFVMKLICITTSTALAVGSFWLVEEGYKNAQYVLLPIAMVIMLYYALNYHKIEFAGATLETACQAILAHPNILTIKLITVVLQVAWAFMATTAAVGLSLKQEAYDTTFEYQTTCEWLGLGLIFFWGQQVLEAVVICTVANTTTIWWFSKTEDICGATFKAYLRAITYSFGSLAIGALIVAIIETIEAYFVFLEKTCTSEYAKKILKAVACVIHWIRKCAEYVTSYAYIYIGIHGYNFCTAGGKVASLFGHHGMTMAGNDAMVQIILFLANVAMGLCCGGVGVLMVFYGPAEWSVGVEDAEVVAGVVCYVIGHAIGATMLASLKSANKTCFICWLENPAALKETHPKYYDRLKKKAEACGMETRAVDLNASDQAHEHVSCCCGIPTHESV